MKCLPLLCDILQEGVYMCKIHLKDANFTIPISKECREHLSFVWKGNLYEFFCLCFGLEQAPLVFTQLSSNSFDHIPTQYYVDNDSATNKLDLLPGYCSFYPAKSKIWFGIEGVDFTAFIKNGNFKSVGRFCENGTFIHWKEPRKNNFTVQRACKEGGDYTWIFSIDRKLGSTAQAVLSAQLQVSCLQRLHIESLNISNLYQAKVELYQDSRVALSWWIEILSLCNGKSVKLQSVTEYLRLTLPFAWNSTLRKKCNCKFLGIFLLVLTKSSFLQGDWVLAYHSMKFRQFLNIS